MSDLIMMLELIGRDDADFKIGAFLQVLLEYHNISAETIALMSGVNEKEVSDLVENPKLVLLESKYKISKTVMALRFFFKEREIVRSDVNEEWGHSGIVETGDFAFINYSSSIYNYSMLIY